MMTLWKMIPAVAAGNCVIAKPSEVTPLSSLFFASLFREAGFPKGVISVLPGRGDEIGNFLSHN
jgi:acyl-CoA reductase-like NAD-dependent aldehyde dehydrogenase